MYEKGLGIAQDLVQAVAWYRKAADQGSAMAQYNMGVMYRDSLGVRRDPAQALKWFRAAADQGHVGARESIEGLLASPR